jgi:LuxR family maltose regulon positive regulatory protein
MPERIKKISDEYYYRPQTAYRQLQSARGTRQTVYIYGATGSGKTSLAADYLIRKRHIFYSGGETDAGELEHFLRVKEKTAGKKESTVTIVVLDDLQFVEGEEQRQAYAGLIDEMSARKDIWLILISRAPIPGWLKLVHTRHVFSVISEEGLRFSREEQDRYMDKRGLALTSAVLDRLWDLGHGHPLFLKMAALRFLEIPEDAADRQAAQMQAIDVTRRDIWDYFETAEREQWDVELQEFLMELSVVDQFDLALAQHITKHPEAGRLIRQALEIGNFMIVHQEGDHTFYELRRPMKYMLRRRLRTEYSKHQIQALYTSAGNSYELEGNLQAALQMYDISGDQDGISRVLIANIRKNPAEGEYFALRNYYLRLEDDKIRSSVELMAGMSLLQSILMNEEESERWYEELKQYAGHQTGRLRRAAESGLLYLDIALPHRGSVGLQSILRHAGTLIRERKAVLPEFSVTSNLPSVMNGGKDFCEWSKKDRAIAKGLGWAAALALGKYGKGLVKLALAESQFEKGGDNYEVLSLADVGRMQAEGGGKTELVFSAVGILTRLFILNNRMTDAVDMLMSFRETAEQDAPRLLPNIDAVHMRMALLTGRNSEMHRWMEQEAPDEDAEFNGMERYRYLTKIRGYLAAGREERALMLLELMEYYAVKMHRTYISIEVSLLKAIALKRMDREDWKKSLQEAVTKAESYHFVRILSSEGAAVYELLKSEDLVWKDASYQAQVMEECRQMSYYYPSYLKRKGEENVLLGDKALIILRLQAEGLTVEEIARKLHISKSGVKYYNQETYRKLGVNNKSAAVAEARNRRLL